MAVKAVGGSAGATGIGEDVGIAEGRLAHEVQKAGHIFLTLAREARDDVRPQPHDGPVGVQAFHGTLEHFCRVVAAAHAAQHGLAGMLQRDVQLRAEHAAGHKGLHPFVIELPTAPGS